MAKIRVIANRALNLHTDEVEGGLIHVPARVAVRVPSDVRDHPQWKHLTKSGILTLLSDDARITDSYEMVAARQAAAKLKAPVTGVGEKEDEDALGPPESAVQGNQLPQASDNEDEDNDKPEPTKEELIAQGRKFDEEGKLIPTKDEWVAAGYSAKAYNEKYGTQ